MNNKKPYCEIIEEPKQLIRFRYACEAAIASITGINSSFKKKTYPTIKINNCSDYKKGAVIISCVNKKKINGKYFIHPHKIVSKDSKKNGTGIRIIDFKINNENNVVIQCCKLGIQHTKRNEIIKMLELRESMGCDPFKAGFKHKSSPHLIDVSAVRLCFQVMLMNDDDDRKDKKIILLEPVVSNVLNNILTNNLRISRLNRNSAFACGGTEVTLLCDKVSKNDIKVLFYQQDDDNKIIWKRYADIICVHRQIGITFKTPIYSEQLSDIIDVFIQLLRPSDGQLSEPYNFKIIPNNLICQNNYKKRIINDDKCEFLPKNELYKKIHLHDNENKYHTLNCANQPGSNDLYHSNSSFYNPSSGNMMYQVKEEFTEQKYGHQHMFEQQQFGQQVFQQQQHQYCQQIVQQQQQQHQNFGYQQYEQQQFGQQVFHHQQQQQQQQQYYGHQQYGQQLFQQQQYGYQQLEQHQYNQINFGLHQQYYNSNMINQQVENYQYKNVDVFNNQDFNQINQLTNETNQTDLSNQDHIKIPQQIFNIINNALPPQLNFQDINGINNNNSLEQYNNINYHDIKCGNNTTTQSVDTVNNNVINQNDLLLLFGDTSNSDVSAY